MNVLFLIVAMFALMWLLLIRPQRRRQLEQSRMLSELHPGDEIVTAGGIYGTIQSVGDDELMLEIAPGTTVRVARRAVGGVFPAEDETDEADSGDEAAAIEEAPGAESDSSGNLPR